MAKVLSAGILLYRVIDNEMQYLICHPGGPFNANKDRSIWSIPKGKVELEEESLDAAIREFKEETGLSEKDYSDMIFLGTIKQKRKNVIAWAARYCGEEDPEIKSNMTIKEWPRKSGKFIEFPENDRAEFVNENTARYKLIRGQENLIDLLKDKLNSV